jgi:hypothetical protein
MTNFRGSGVSRLLAFALAAFAIQVVSSCSAANQGAASFPTSAADEKAIRECFESYRQLALAQQGAEAAELVSNSTFEYYDELRRLALTGSAATIKEQSVGRRMMVLMYRHRYTRDDLQRMNGRELFVDNIDKGWIGKDSARDNELGDVKASGDSAAAEIVNKGKASGLKFQFLREGGAWRIDFASFLPKADLAFKAAAKEMEMEEDEMIFTILEAISGKKVPVTIWEPLETQ